MKSLIFIFILISCSSNSVEMVSFNHQRVNLKQTEYTKPDFYILKKLPSKRIGRSIASTESRMDKYSDLNNKELYFLTLYNQYLDLNKIGNHPNKINFCPAFHQVYIEHKRASVKFNWDKKFLPKLKNKNLALNPILSLPYKSQELYSYLEKEKWNKAEKHIIQATKQFKNQQFKELEQLCDSGSSSNYFVFENLISTHIQESSFGKNLQSLRTILKVSVFANLLILDNLNDAKNVNRYNEFDLALFTRANVTWFKDYIDDLSQRRQSKVVKREFNNVNSINI